MVKGQDVETGGGGLEGGRLDTHVVVLSKSLSMHVDKSLLLCG